MCFLHLLACFNLYIQNQKMLIPVEVWPNFVSSFRDNSNFYCFNFLVIFLKHWQQPCINLPFHGRWNPQAYVRQSLNLVTISLRLDPGTMKRLNRWVLQWKWLCFLFKPLPFWLTCPDSGSIWGKQVWACSHGDDSPGLYWRRQPNDHCHAPPFPHALLGVILSTQFSHWVNFSLQYPACKCSQWQPKKDAM